MVVAASESQAEDNARALECLCQQYWFPLYAFVRRSGYQSSDAQDLTQAFFERMIERRFIRVADPKRGRFRTFLLASLKNFLTNEWKKSTQQKRGGGKPVLSLDFDSAEQRLSYGSPESLSADRLFDRQWALSVLDQVIQRLQQHYESAGNQQLFTIIQPYLTADSQTLPYQQTAEKHQMTVGQIKVNVHRMRNRYRELLVHEIANTVDSPECIDDEIRQLFAALS
jgi:RNA polymerase sigma-70 factor (ECF subfamily)